MSETPEQTPGREQRLGEILASARTSRGLELGDIAEATHVRKEYLKALEEGRYGDLPEDVYTRNFLRLYAQAVGLDAERTLERYRQERRQAAGLNTLEQKLERERGAAARQATEPREREARLGPPRRGPQIGGLLSTLVMVGAVVGLALWGFNATFFNPARNRPAPVDRAAGLPAGAAVAAPAVEEALALPRTVRLSVASNPPGAEVTVDEFPLPGTTPIVSAPVTAREGRMVRVSLEGYQPVEAEVDLSFDRNLSFDLQPLAAGAALPPAGEPLPAEGAATPAATPGAGVTGTGEVALAVTETTWLEVYSGVGRNQGERLVFTTANPGQSFRFPLPVYVHTGNAAGLSVTVNGQDRGAFGSAGEVIGRAITQ